MTERLTMHLCAAAYRRLVDHRDDMQAMGHKENTPDLVARFYPGGPAQFQADSDAIVEANRQFYEAPKEW